jgi:hypothetical protein
MRCVENKHKSNESWETYLIASRFPAVLKKLKISTLENLQICEIWNFYGSEILEFFPSYEIV